MPRNFQPVEFNTFVGGLVTEASPLTFPENASLDEENFVLNRDGSRERRQGMAFEPMYQEIDTGQVYTNKYMPTSMFMWEGAGGNSGVNILCVQIRNHLNFFYADELTVSEHLIDTFAFSDVPDCPQFSYSIVDGKLAVTSSSQMIRVFTYKDMGAGLGQITVTTDRLLIRDLFGIEDMTVGGNDLREGTMVSKRPPWTGDMPYDSHIYNLRNQGWAVPKPGWAQNNETPRDTIKEFFAYSAPNLSWPSNADNITSYIYANTESSSSKTTDRFDAGNMVGNPPNNTQAPIGYFVIDLLNRSDSRKEQLQELKDKFPQVDQELTQRAIDAIKVDKSQQGPTCTAQLAGRAWFAGFSNKHIGGDRYTPLLGSYVLFSKLVKSEKDFFKCYQDADPTDVESSDLVDTDGGFVKVDGAYNILALCPLFTSVVVLAESGVWAISGGQNGQFTATNYQVTKLSDSGCVSKGSVVVAQDTLFFFGKDGIYTVTRNQYGDLVCANISNATIKKYYLSLPASTIGNSKGFFDYTNGWVSWQYFLDEDTIQLNLDTASGAYFKYRLKSLPSGLPLSACGIMSSKTRRKVEDFNVLVGSDEVQTSINDDVVVGTAELSDTLPKPMFLIITGV